MAKSFSVTLDTSGLYRGLDKLDKQVDEWVAEALEQMADSLILLSSYEVPHLTGQLQSTAHKFPTQNEVKATGEINVAYDTEYAAYQHEGMRKDGTRVITHYNNGRKGKYLQDPLLNNFKMWQGVMHDTISAKLNGEI